MSKMLSSWKEIAHFFGKGVRTVQRWEKTLELPIHRPPGAPSNVVLARVSDLEEWMHRGAVAKAVAAEESNLGINGESAVFASLAELENEVAVLAAKLNTRTTFVDGQSSAPERIGAIKVTIAQLAGVAAKAELKQAA